MAMGPRYARAREYRVPVTTHSFWHPFADMSVVAGHDFVITGGQGAVVHAADGREYLDGTAALWYANVGHGRTEIADAVARQMSAIASYSNFGDYATQPTLDLADRLAAMAPVKDARVFFTSGGSDSVDTAAKLARRYWQVMGEHERTTIITRTRSYHGMHMAGTALAGIPGNREGYGTLDAHVRNVDWDDPWALAKEIDHLGQDKVAAFFCEPIIGAGGVHIAPEGYMQEVRAICRERGVLFVADEVITGYGRTGAMFGSELFGLDPDMLLTAKGLTSGYLPMGAVFIAGHIAEPFWTTPGLIWRHGYTYSGHAASAAAAMANLDIIERENLVTLVAENQLALRAALLTLRDHDLVTEVRGGVGLLGAVQIDALAAAADSTLLPRILKEARKRGVLTRILADGGLQISPPFVMTREQMQQMAHGIDEALVAVGSGKSARHRDDVELEPSITRDEVGGFGSRDAELRANVPPHHS